MAPPTLEMRSKITLNNLTTEKNILVHEMTEIQNIIKDAIKNANKTKDFRFISGDLQDTPDNSKDFHYGKCRIPKHPLGIFKGCETAGLTCTIY